MRRLFAILLLAFLPLQFSWAAVAGYCGHESGAQAQHLGHHDHQHTDHADQTDQTDVSMGDDQANAAGPTGSDFDCGHCHTSCCNLPALANTPLPLAIASHPVTPGESILRTLAQTPPERPQWLRFA